MEQPHAGQYRVVADRNDVGECLQSVSLMIIAGALLGAGGSCDGTPDWSWFSSCPPRRREAPALDRSTPSPMSALCRFAAPTAGHLVRHHPTTGHTLAVLAARHRDRSLAAPRWPSAGASVGG